MKKVILLILILVLLWPMNIFASTSGVVDEADIFDENEIAKLQNRIDKIEEKYDVSIVIYTSYEYYFGDDIRVWAADYYDYGGYKDNGLIFAINMANREYAIVSSGDIQKTFNASCIDKLLDYSEDDMIDGDYYEAVATFLDCSNNLLSNPDYLKQLARKDNLVLIAGSSLTGAGVITITFIIFCISNMKMKSKQKRASFYIKPHSLSLSRANDLYLYSTTTKTRVNTQSSSSSRSGSFKGSSGRSHTGGSRRF